MDRSVGSPWTRSVVGSAVFGLPHLVHVGSGKYFDLIILTLHLYVNILTNF